MANLKELIVSGVSRFIGKVYSSSGFVGDLEGTASNASKVNNHTVNADVPNDAKFTDTTYPSASTSSDGLMTTNMVTKLNSISDGANKTTVENVLTSTSTSNALSAYQGKALKTLVDGKASSSHSHDDRYYTESEINNKLNGKANSIHKQAYTSSELDTYTSDENTYGTTPAGVKKAIKKCFSVSGTTLTINTNW